MKSNAARVELNGAGIAVFSGTKGRKQLANVTWEKLVERLTKLAHTLAGWL